MIVLDTSALLAILLREPVAERCQALLESSDQVLMSAGTLAEALLVAQHRGVGEAMDHLLTGLDVEIIPVDEAEAKRVAQAYARWGRDRHAANLNFGDCFASAVARRHDCPLLFVGNDFGQTDIASTVPL
ncbi:twitching motility protein PilT [Bosea sp. AAP35]|uniref:type II toxin-antitoxin system VapC family toxin n=1 Tax=Bosea sp. AAP35 TaxID=1523417 RepID=UPI0006B8DF07|nr:type II toxin-antitoxin system VapC family toxin [Bosea sp. AAP35]KPF71631.1 twitching motility protein PilT [Bosea sp. AAP35]